MAEALASQPSALPSTAGDVLPLPRPVDRRRVLRAAALWTVALVILLLFIRFDIAIMSWIGTFRAYRKDWYVELFRVLGEIGPLIALVLVVGFDRRRRWITVHVLFAALIGFGLVHLGKMMIHRERPFRFETLQNVPWQASWHGIDPSFSRRASLSTFPSGHTMTAFAGAITLGWFFARARPWLLLLAAGCALSRVVQDQHWPSDVWAGAMVGCFSAWVSLRVRALTTPRELIRRKRARPVEG
jgi:undecaprenyl-diphosphatase